MLERLLEEAMHNYVACTHDEHFTSVVAAFIKTHPCLTEVRLHTPNFVDGQSLKFKMGNFCTNLRRSEMDDVTVNSNRKRKDIRKRSHQVVTSKGRKGVKQTSCLIFQMDRMQIILRQ